MHFNVEEFVLLVYPFKCMAAITIHKSISIGCTTITEKYHHLMNCLWNETEKVPDSIRIFAIIFWIAFLGVNEIRKLNRISDEEHRSIIAHEIIVPFLGVKLDCIASWISLSVSSPTLTSYGTKPKEDWSLLSNFG